MNNEFLNVTELCGVLRVSKRHLSRLVEKGLPIYKLSVNGYPRFDLNEVKQWMSENAARSHTKETIKT